MIQKITLNKKFKSLRPFTVESLQNFVLVVGCNSTGKSQLLHLFSKIPEEIYNLKKDQDYKLLFGAEGINTNVIKIPNNPGSVSYPILSHEPPNAHEHMFGSRNNGPWSDNHVGLKWGGGSIPFNHIQAEYTNKIARLKTQQITLNSNNTDLEILTKISEKRAELKLLEANPPEKEINHHLKIIGFPLKISLDKEKGLVFKKDEVFLQIKDLSSSEQLLFTLFQYYYKWKLSDDSLELVIFDEFDKSFDPENCQKLIHLINELFVDQGIKVVFSTHSPITVGLVDPSTTTLLSIEHDREGGYVQKVNQEVVLTKQLQNIKNITVNLFESKEVFVEGSADKDYYTVVLNILQTSRLINSRYRIDTSSPIQFLSTGQNGDQSDCTIVKDLVSSFRRGGKQSVFGVVDWDGIRSSTEEIFTLGENQRYAIDNYLLDPVVIIYLIIESRNRRSGVAKSINDKLETLGIVSSQTLVQIQDSGVLQEVVNIYFDTLCSDQVSVLSAEEIQETIPIKYVNGIEIKVPKRN